MYCSSELSLPWLLSKPARGSDIIRMRRSHDYVGTNDEMRIEYQLTPEDWAAFGEHCARTAPGFQRSMYVGRVFGMAVILVAAVVPGSQSGSFIWFAAGIVAALVWAWLWPRYVIA